MSSLYPGSYQIAPMKYANKPSDSQVFAAWESDDWIGQEKKDGAWYQLEKTDDGEIYLFGRTISKKTGEYTEKIDNVPHIKQWAEQLPNGTILIGEIYVPGGKSNDVTKIMGCTSTNAYKRQFESDAYGGPIHFYVFDILRYESKLLIDVPFIERYEKYLNYELGHLFEPQPATIAGLPFVELSKVYYDNFEEHLNNIFAAGGEGMVFKKKDCPYRAGMRTTAKQMFKYKEHMDSIDLVCMELLDPIMEYTGKEIKTWPYWRKKYQTENGTWLWVCEEGCLYKEYLTNPDLYMPVTKPDYLGWKNAMRLGAYKNNKLVEVCRVASGLTDEIREDMANNPNNYLNQVIEIECMSVDKNAGTVRHPVFKRVREDKSPDDCLWDEIFGE